jgi:predicted HicB family RNase H-like nuclease
VEKRIRSYRKRLILNIDPAIHRALVEAARLKEITVTKYVLQTLARQIIKDKLHE